MQPVLTLYQMFPSANKDNVEVQAFEDGSWEITKWDLIDPQPTKEEIEAYWAAHEQEIMNANKPAPTDMDDLKKQMADLSYTLMLNGVI